MCEMGERGKEGEREGERREGGRGARWVVALRSEEEGELARREGR